MIKRGAILVILIAILAQIGYSVTTDSNTIVNLHSFNNQISQRTILLTTETEPLLVSVSAIGDIKKWLKFDLNDRVNRDEPLKININLDPPDNINYGQYEGYIILDFMYEQIPKESLEDNTVMLKTIVTVDDNKVKDTNIIPIKLQKNQDNNLEVVALQTSFLIIIMLAIVFLIILKMKMKGKK